jgi:NAD(P)H-hydrate epimerase
MRVLTAEQMREVDRVAIEEIGVPSMVLMENAALGVVEAIGERYGEARCVALVCGPGNNGGDGLAIGRQLATRGYRPHLFVVHKPGGTLSGDAGRQLDICRRLELPVWEVTSDGDPEELVEEVGHCDLVVDALFGTGLGRPLEGYFAELVTALNRLPLPRVAVDLPSGLAGGESAIPGPSLRADLTVTFAAPKIAHLFAPAADRVGEVVVADLGVPVALVDAAAGERVHLLTCEEVGVLLPPPRRPAQHKGSFGHALLVAGGPGGAGAAVLAARAAGRSGAGLVTVATPASLRTAVDAGSAESMVTPLPEASPGRLAPEARRAVLAACEGKSALGVGPGLGSFFGPSLGPGLGSGRRGESEAGHDLAATLRALCLEAELPLVLDADGLNAFAGRLGELSHRTAPTVLTPHPGELGRLLEIPTGEVQEDRRGAVRRAACESGAVVLLKGHQTLICAPDGELWLNPTGNPSMATGGSGDVLTGMITAFVAQGLSVRPAACAAAYLHGLAGDLAAERLAEGTVVAGDLIDDLPAAFRWLQQNHR